MPRPARSRLRSTRGVVAFVLAFVLAFVVSACSGSGPLVPTSRAPPCAAFAAEQRILVRAARARYGDDVPFPTSFGACFSAGSGAFGISVDAVEDAPTLSGRWSLVHLDAAGQRVAIGPHVPSVIELVRPEAVAESTKAEMNLRRGVVLDPPTLADLDGDGAPEIFLRISLTFPSGEVWASGRIWTFRAGAIARYADLTGEVMRDVDGDGRLDLLTHGAFVGLGRLDSPGTGFQRLHGPLFLAHGDAVGGFHLDDAVARAFALTACPTKPNALLTWVGAMPASVDDARTATNIACARTWGMSSEAARQVVEEGCRKAADPCMNVERFGAFANGAPPLGLP